MQLTQNRNGGFTLLELSITIMVLTIGLMALGGILVSVSSQRKQLTEQNLVLQRTEGLLEEIKAQDPSLVAENYGGKTYVVADSTNGDNTGTLTVAVDASNEKLVAVTVNGQWSSCDHSEDIVLSTELYSSAGSQTGVGPTLNASATWDSDLFDPLFDLIVP